MFWGGREGYQSLLNTDVRRELDNFAAFLRMAADYKKVRTRPLSCLTACTSGPDRGRKQSTVVQTCVCVCFCVCLGLCARSTRARASTRVRLM